MEDRNGILKTHSTISKKARGAFLTAVMEESCQTIDALRDLSFDDFYYRKDLSSDSELFFVRKVRLFLISCLYDRLAHSFFDRHSTCPR